MHRAHSAVICWPAGKSGRTRWGFGIDADAATGAVIAHDGRLSHRLYAVGHPLRGAAWEASSIVEQIEGATRVARALSSTMPIRN